MAVTNAAAYAAVSNAPRAFHKADLENYLAEGEKATPTEVAGVEDANVVSSLAAGHVSGESWSAHFPVLDIDFPASLVPSSTPGHYHLYLDRAVPEDAYFKLLWALQDAVILQRRYVESSMERGYTSVRFPGAKKEK